MTTTPLLQVVNLSKSYNLADQEVPVLRNVSFTVNAGELVAIMGKSGVGKSTLLHVLGGLDRPDTGTIDFQGESLTALGDAELAAFRSRYLGFVFQFHHLQPELTALENVAMPGLIARRTRQDVSEKAKKLLDRVGLASRVEHRPSELSGGEQQRVAIARALMNEPALILADEPTGNLDEPTSESIHELLREVNEDTGAAIIVVTHSPVLATKMKRKIILSEGQIISDESATPLS